MGPLKFTSGHGARRGEYPGRGPTDETLDLRVPFLGIIPDCRVKAVEHEQNLAYRAGVGAWWLRAHRVFASSGSGLGRLDGTHDESTSRPERPVVAPDRPRFLGRSAAVTTPDDGTGT